MTITMNVIAIDNPIIIIIVPLSLSTHLVIIINLSSHHRRFVLSPSSIFPHHHQGILSSSSICPLVKCPVVIVNLSPPHHEIVPFSLSGYHHQFVPLSSSICPIVIINSSPLLCQFGLGNYSFFYCCVIMLLYLLSIFPTYCCDRHTDMLVQLPPRPIYARVDPSLQKEPALRVLLRKIGR
jgi:hypothetical protein